VASIEGWDDHSCQIVSTHPPALPAEREGSESPSAVRGAGHKSSGLHALDGERGASHRRVKAKPFGWPAASLDPRLRRGPEARSGSPAGTNPANQVSTVRGD
jgi:hypothetical protein